MYDFTTLETNLKKLRKNGAGLSLGELSVLEYIVRELLAVVENTPDVKELKMANKLLGKADKIIEREKAIYAEE